MFGALRRCPGSISRTLSYTVCSSRVLRTSTHQPLAAIRTSAPRIPNVAIAAFHQTAKWQEVAPAQVQTQDVAGNDGTITRFSELAMRGLVHPNIIDVITKRMKIEDMTEVQSRTINEALSGSDVIAQAKTGTGKTLGFLVPIVQRIVENDPNLAQKARGYKRARPDDIRAIIISPTRELAEQIAVEARKVTSGTGVVVQVAVGGTQKNSMLQKTQREGCHLMIGTPGRLLDILSDPYSGVKAPNLNALVMDEADRLLDAGFTQEIDQIKEYLPNPEEVERQTLMFSATIPREVVDLVRRTLKPGFHFAKCVDEDEAPTHERVPQKVVQLTGFENTMPALYEFILREFQKAKAGNDRPFKAIVYFNSTSEVTLAASVFYKLSGGFKRDRPLHGLNSFEIHSRLSQMQRTRASDSFRHANSAVLFSSDVTARGMDFPNVTHVIQIGLPRDRDTYIHRIGRTGRAGKEGEGWLFLSPLEKYEVKKRLRGLPLSHDHSLETASVDMAEESEIPEDVAGLLKEVGQTYQRVRPDELNLAFKGLFGSYQWYGDKNGLLDAANRLAEFGWGLPQPPSPPSSFLQARGSGGNRGGFGGQRGGYRSRDNDPFSRPRSRANFADRSFDRPANGGRYRNRHGGAFGSRNHGGERRDDGLGGRQSRFDF